MHQFYSARQRTYAVPNTDVVAFLGSLDDALRTQSDIINAEFNARGVRARVHAAVYLIKRNPIDSSQSEVATLADDMKATRDKSLSVTLDHLVGNEISFWALFYPKDALNPMKFGDISLNLAGEASNVHLKERHDLPINPEIAYAVLDKYGRRLY